MKVFALMLLLSTGAVFAVRITHQKNYSCNFSAFDPEEEEEAKVVDRWRATFSLVRLSGDGSDDLQRLKNESCDGSDRRMCLAFTASLSKSNASIAELTSAERVAVAMYTDQRSRFNQRHKAALDKNRWKRYIIYTSLLQSAVKKLSIHYPTSSTKPLYYEEMKCSRPPKNNRSIFYSKRIFWKSFMLLTLQDPGPRHPKLTVLMFKPPLVMLRGGRIPFELSMFDSNAEVLIPPFEVFDVRRKEAHMFCLQHPIIQPFLPPPDNTSATVTSVELKDQEASVVNNSGGIRGYRDTEFLDSLPTSKELNVKASAAAAAAVVFCSHRNWHVVSAVVSVGCFIGVR